MIKNTSSIILILLFTFITSCTKKDAPEPAKESSKTTTVITAEKRAGTRWTALINGDWKSAYSFATPSYRKNYTVENFRNKFGGAVTWKTVRIISSTKISETIIDVQVELTYLFTDSGMTMELPSKFVERWTLVDNQWWHTSQE